LRKRYQNPRLAKIHRSYTVDEIADLYAVGKNTVRHWIKQGLPACDSKRPMLVLGSELNFFHEKRRIVESPQPTLNSDFGIGAKPHVKTPS